MMRETININVLDGIDSINSLGNEDFYDDTDTKEEPEVKIEKKEEVQNKKAEQIENKKDEKNNEKDKEKNEEKFEKEVKKEETKSNDEDEDEVENEKIIEKKLDIIKAKLIYSLKDDIKFMRLPEGKMPSNKNFYLILFTVLTSISIISDIFSTIISEYKGQISCAVFAILFRGIFISSNFITIKYEFQALLMFQLILNNCLCCYSVLFIIYLNIYHRESFSNKFIWFCYIFYYISIGCNFINIIYLYIKYFKVYVSMTEDDIKYLRIYNKRTTVNEMQLIDKKE